MLRKSICFLALVGAVSLAAPMALTGGETAQAKIASTDWAGVRGVNFLPSYSSNTYEIWRDYNHDLFDRELRLVPAVGYNSVRLWLNYAAFEELGPKMVDRVQDALKLCAKYHLRVVLNIFDACGARPRKDAQWMTASEAYDHFMNSPRLSAAQKQYLQDLFGQYAKGFGKDTLVPVGSDSPFMVILWQNAQPTPGNDRLGPGSYRKLEAYVDALLGRLKDNPNILLWDLMNEPEFASEGPLTPTELITPEMEKVRDAFLRHFHDYIKQRYPNEIISVGWARWDNVEKYVDLADVITFHIYGGPRRLQAQIDQAWAFSRKAGKQILITETLANWQFGAPDLGSLSDEGQLAHYRQVLPVLMKSPIGWMAWGMVMSRYQFPFTDIFYPDGHPRPAATYLEKVLKGEEPAP